MVLRNVVNGLLIALAVNVAPAHAVPVSFSFTGSVTDDPFGLSSFGAPITGSYTFDSDALDGIAGPSTGSYASVGAPYGFAVTVDGTAYAVFGSVTINTANDIGVDQYGVIADNGSLVLELFLEDATQTALTDDALPLSVPLLADFAFRQFRLFGPDSEFLGTIDSLVCTAGCDVGGGGGTVPEPASVWLLAFGLFGVWLRRRTAGGAAVA